MPAENNGAILWIHAITAMHPGSGSALGAVDLPVQRERHTDWPVIPGSSLKGVLRDAHARGADEATTNRLFGSPDDNNASAGALSFTDARLLLFPVRSLRGVFAWVTCPQALRRWQRDARLAGITVELPKQLTVAEDQALVPQGCPCLDKNELILEEFKFTAKPDAAFQIKPKPLNGEDLKRIVILNDSDFTHFARHATEITARIRLKQETKTVEQGALFYQEFIPAEAVFYSLVAEAERVPGALKDYQPPANAQIGGEETTGKGLCLLSLEKKEGN